MAGLFTRLLKQDLASQAGFLLVTTVTGYAFSYLYLVFMGRLLGPEVFGILGALFAIFYIACLVGQALRGAIATKVAEVKAQAGEATAVSTFIKQGIKISLLCLVPCIAFIIAAQPVATFFHLSDRGPIIILAFSLFTALVLDIVQGLQQGLQKFRALGISGYLTSPGLKVVLGVGFVLAGWGLSGAVGALFASTAIATVVALVLVRKPLAGRAKGPGQHSSGIGPILLPTLILAIFLSMPTSIDVILVTHYFGGTDAGLYSAMATVGKVVIFLPMAVSFILLPRATEDNTLGRDTSKILLWSLALVFLLSGSVVIVCWAFPGLIVNLFFGEAYTGAKALLGFYAAAMLVFSLNSVLIHYSLAVRQWWLMILADAVTILEVVLIVLRHETISGIIWVLLFGNLLIFIFSLGYFVFNRFGRSNRD